MFGRKKGVTKVVRPKGATRGVSEALGNLPPQAGQLANDLRSQLAEVTAQLQELKGWRQKKRSHKTRNLTLLLTGAGAMIAAVPALRNRLLKVVKKVRGGNDKWAPGEPSSASVEEEIEVGVPVSTAYNQWTQFEEFPKFMEGIDEVKQIDDTLLHWAATVAGKKAEWDAKITEQTPDRRIAWESVEGKHNRGAVTFEPAGSSRTRIRLDMSYTPEGAAEKTGSAVGLDSRRVRGDLERFRELIEERGAESGAWRGEIKEGETKQSTKKTTGSNEQDS